MNVWSMKDSNYYIHEAIWINNRSIKNIGVYILLLLFASVGMFALMDRLLIVTKLDLNDGVADASIKSSYTI